MIFTNYSPDLPIEVIAQREYVACKAAGVQFSTRNFCEQFLYCFPTELVEPSLRSDPDAPFYIFIVKAGIGDAPTRILACYDGARWMEQADAAIAAEEKGETR